MTTKFFTNQDGNTLFKKFDGILKILMFTILML